MKTVMVLVSFLVGCAGDGTTVELGRLDNQGITHVEVPDTISVGETFSITILTYGSSCYSAESTDVVMTDDGATVSVYDQIRTGPCLANIMPIEHHNTLRFDSAGTKTITVHGADAQMTARDYTVTVDVQ